MKFKKKSFSFIHQYISAVLIFLLFISQTIHVSFFDKIEAATTDYRDIVSIIVDESTYNNLRGQIRTYANDIQGYLKNTRVTIYVAPESARPEVIAAHNEKLYYEGDGQDGISSLVGTVIIGNIPIPVVHKEGTSFPSLYPYVDFDDKRFVYDTTTRRYNFSQDSNEGSDVDIWHGVINPAVGSDWNAAVDVPKIGAFLDKTHEFYTRSGKFVPQTLPPRVYYYDGYAESLSTDPTTMYKYALFTQNAENVEYKRWGKALLKDITTSLAQFQKANSGAEDALAASVLGPGATIGDESIDPATLESLPDIQTATPIMSYLKRFHETINKKTLSDIQEYVHNAGRYNSGINVRVDQGAVQVSITDQVSMDVLKNANDAIESSIDSILTSNNYARRIPILDGIWERSPILTNTVGAIPASIAANPLVEYKNYYFGREAQTITSPEQCTIARGWSGATDLFKRPLLAEANVMYNLNSVQGHIGYLSGDTDTMVRLWRNANYACFTQAGVPKLNPYFGGNSLLRLMVTGEDPTNFLKSPPSGTALTGFSKSIYDIEGMKETTRLPNPSLADCTGNQFQYTLLQPHTFSYDVNDSWSYNGGTYNCTGAYPLEWSNSTSYCPNNALTNSPRFTCNTVHTSYPGGSSMNDALAVYNSPCYYGSLIIDGKYFNNTASLSVGQVNLGGQCIIPGNAYNGVPDIDNTIYQNRVFHTIPSLLKHVSPTSAEIAAAKANGATPSIPVDAVRTVEFLTQKGGIARLTYPNFFEAPTTTIADVRAWLKTLSDTEWNGIIAAESARAQTALDRNVASSVGANPLPNAPIDWNSLITDDVIEKIIRAKRSLAPNVTKKYQNLLEAGLSYSHTSSGDILDNPLPLPKLSQGYEIAYLGLTPFTPKGQASEEDSSLQGYQYQLGELQGLNFAEQDPALTDPDPSIKAQAECGPPDGVPLFQWPSAIQCWIKTLFPIKIMPGSCGSNTIGISQGSISSAPPPIAIAGDSANLRTYYGNAQMVYSIERTMIQPGGNIEIQYYLNNNGVLVELPPDASIELSISSVTASGQNISPDKYGDYVTLSSTGSTYTNEGASFVVNSVGPFADISLVPKLTVPLPDGTKYESVGSQLTLKVRDEYVEVLPKAGTTPISSFETTNVDPLTLNFEAKQGTGINIPTSPPYKMNIFDDVSGVLVESGITINTDSYTLGSKYRDTIGVYRFVVSDASGRAGEATLAVRSGPVASMDFIPVSSSVVTGKESVGVLRLLDSKGNLVSPSLLHLTASITNGAFIDGAGAFVPTMIMDSTESEILFRYMAGSIGNMSMNFSITDPNISKSSNVNIIDIPKVHIIRSATPKVGDAPITVDIELRDPVTNTPISGFSSLATLDIPPGAGTFDKTTVNIENGRAEQVKFTPGKVAGDHVFTIEIAGVGNTTEKKFNVLPGVPMYIDGTITSTNIEFALRDRYGNLSPESLPGTLKLNQDLPTAMNFTDGKYIMPRAPGYWKVEAPSIKLNTITYVDNDNGSTSTTATGTVTKTITGIPFYQLFVPDIGRKYGFRPDYSARYTVLAGDSYLSEGSQILYETTPGQSQSLAVSTILSSPYEKESLFSIYPGGGYSVGATSDTAIETNVRNRTDSLHLEAYDTASQTPIARVAYPMKNLSFSSCIESSSDVSECSILGNQGAIMFVTYKGDTTTIQSNANEASIIIDNVEKVKYNANTGLSLGEGVTLSPLGDQSVSSLILDISDNGNSIGKLIVHADEIGGVSIGDSNIPVNTLTLDEKFSYSLTPSYSDIFTSQKKGYSLVRNPSSQMIDERLVGPSRIESFGALLDVPGVGWHGNNRTLLSFAAGDTVGEATRWFHTYTLINLGDPVAHVDLPDSSKGIAAPPETEMEGVDRTIGTQIAGSSDRYIQSYKRKDMNGDGLQDVIVVYSDGFIELYLNMGGTFRKKEKIAYIPYITPLGIELGDFTGDKYADIIALDRSGSLALVDNGLRKLKETLIKVTGDAPPNGVTQYKVYDMDNDGRDDIVYLTEGGELAILYGTNIAGTFEKKVLESNLGVTLSADPEKGGGAIKASITPTSLLSNPTGTGADESVLNNEVFYLLQSVSGSPAVTTSDVSVIDATFTGSFTDPNEVPVYSGSSATGVLYVKSEYAPAYGLDVEKRYTNLSSTTVHGGDRIQVEIHITNSGSQIAKNVSYLDRVAKIFEIPEDSKYQVQLGGLNQEKDFAPLSGEEYDLMLQGVDIPPGQTLKFLYELTATPASYGDMIVDNLEKNLAGDDPFGDVGFETSNTCGADMVVWNSTANRSYLRGIRSFTAADLPPGLAAKLADANANGIPDSIEFASGSSFTGGAQATLTNEFNNITNSATNNQTNILNVNVNPSGQLASIGFSPNVERELETTMQNLADGLSCGFGGGGCLSSPINWAPLAPGNAISVLGSPVGRSPAVNQGIPIFAALTRMDVGVTPYCFTFPVVWPISPLSLNASLPCSSTNVATAWGEAVSQMPTAFVGQSSASTTIGAGGVLGTQSSSNFLRIFVTPTLTLGMGTAICMGPASTNGPNPLYPLVSKGNCIVMTKSLPVCKGDGSAADGDVTGISGLGTSRDSWNSNSCSMKAATSLTPAQEKSMIDDIVSYLKSPNTTRLNSIYKNISARGGKSVNLGGPAIKLGDPGSSGTAIDIDLDSSKPFEIGKIVKVNNKRIAGFPEFIMDWVSRQTEEITNKLFTLPNLVIYTPKSYGPNTSGDLSELTKSFSEASIKKGVDDFSSKIGRAGNASNTANELKKKTTGKTPASAGYDKWLDGKIGENASTINAVSGGANQWRQAWKLIGQIPFVQVEQVSVPINIPWLLPQDLDRYARSLKQYEREWNRAQNDWCVGKTPQQCADIKTNTNASGVQSTIKKTMKSIEDWRRFPEKLQKYITWKQRYVTQILCNIDILERMVGGWYRDNGIRFKKWAEFYVLIRTIAETWQPFLDLWRDKDRSCSVCQNQRWDLKYWKFKMLSAIIPQIPILQFPRWPDIVLDLSDIRFGVIFRVPDFRFNISPIRLPDLPAIRLPNAPTGSLNLGFNFNIPPPPNLPNLPDLPSLPNIRLPNLPTPPKLPKLFGAVSVGINIFKLYTKIQCYMEKTLLVPEDYAGATIAQRTDRQGTLPFDFLNFRLPQIALGAWPREIRVATHVNFQIKSDFIVEFAKAAVKPINEFSTDLARMPKKFVPDVNIQGPGNKTINVHGAIQTHDYDKIIAALSHELTKDQSNELLSVEEFTPYLRSELLKAGLDVAKFDRSLTKARDEADTYTKKLQDENKEGFRLLREYLHAEEAETKELEKFIDRLKNGNTLLSSRDVPQTVFVSETPSLSDSALNRYNRYQKKRLASNDSFVPDDFDQKLASIGNRMSRLLAAGVGPNGSSSSAQGYSPSFNGIYILSPISKTQTRLFDYTSLLQGDEEADVTDIDGDGDNDYLFLLGGSLYIKYNHQNAPQRAVDLSISTINTDPTLLPEVPNSFKENVASPGQIYISFRKAHPGDTSFRLEFFNRYLEWDRVKLNGSDFADTPRTIVDLTVMDSADDATVTPDYTESPIARSLESASVSQDFVLEGMKVTTLLSGQPFGLSTGRPIYTGNGQAVLSVTLEGTGEQKDYTLERFKKYTFPDSLSGSITSGKAYILTPSGTEKLSYTNDMLGMPLLPGTRVIDTSHTISVYNPIENISTQIPVGTEYRHIGLTGKNASYSVNFPYENGYYSARLRSLRTGNLIRAGITLLAPLAALDRSAPVVELTDQKVPVYQTVSIPLTDAVSEASSFSLLADPDVTQDSDANGGYADDFVASASGVSITQNQILFGQYDTLGSRMMNLRVVDSFGNRSISPLKVEVYAPVPKIVSVSTGGVLSGALEEEISQEPIHLFRVRQGDGIKLLDQTPLLTDAGGKFSLANLFGANNTLSVTSGNSSTTLSPATGLPLNDPNISSVVVPATATDPLQIRFTNTSTNTPLFKASIVPPATLQVIGPNISYTGSSPVLRVDPLGGTQTIVASLSDPNIPGGMYITQASSPIIAIDSHGQIYLLDSAVSLRAAEEGGNLVLYASKGGFDVAKLSYLFDFFVAGK